jgi:hypothetical protein
MSASSSSRIDPAIGHLAALGQSLVDERSDVLSVLGRRVARGGVAGSSLDRVDLDPGRVSSPV